MPGGICIKYMCYFFGGICIKYMCYFFGMIHYVTFYFREHKKDHRQI